MSGKAISRSVLLRTHIEWSNYISMKQSCGQRKPIRVYTRMQCYAGYLYWISSNRAVLKKFGKRMIHLSYLQVIVAAVNAEILMDGWSRYEIPDYYVRRNFLRCDIVHIPG